MLVRQHTAETHRNLTRMGPKRGQQAANPTETHAKLQTPPSACRLAESRAPALPQGACGRADPHALRQAWRLASYITPGTTEIHDPHDPHEVPAQLLQEPSFRADLTYWNASRAQPVMTGTQEAAPVQAEGMPQGGAPRSRPSQGLELASRRMEGREALQA